VPILLERYEGKTLSAAQLRSRASVEDQKARTQAKKGKDERSTGQKENIGEKELLMTQRSP